MTSNDPFDFDLFVIGGGSGGVRAARFAAQRGARVALAEYGPMGGTCVNVGCIPKKLYSYAALYAEAFAEAPGYGWRIDATPQLSWDALKAARAQEISRLNGIYENLMTGAQVTRLHGHASLVDAHTVRVRSADGASQQHRARHILIATGGQPHVPEDLLGRELVITSDDIFDLPRFPRRLVVVGGGYIGCEMACILHGLGAQVTQIYRGELILRGFDEDVRQFMADEITRQGIDLRQGTDVTRIEAQGEARRVHLSNGQTIDADAVLYATGRRPNVASLQLDALGVRQSSNGAIEVGANFATSVPSIHALGDVLPNSLELTPVALAEAMALVDHLFGPLPGQAPRQMDYNNIPTAVFTHPPIGTVGLTEAQARAQHPAIRVYRSDFRPLKHTLSGSGQRTLVKLIVDDASDRVVGLHMVGADAGEITQGFAVALKAGATKAQFDATVGIHPTSAEEFVTLREVTRR